jgi:hypothetical protein
MKIFPISNHLLKILINKQLTLTACISHCWQRVYFALLRELPSVGYVGQYAGFPYTNSTTKRSGNLPAIAQPKPACLAADRAGRPACWQTGATAHTRGRRAQS